MTPSLPARFAAGSVAAGLLVGCPGDHIPPQTFEADGRCGYLDAQGHVMLPARWQVCEWFDVGGIAAAADERGWQWIDTAGNALPFRPFIVDNAPDNFGEGLARFVGEDGRIGFIDIYGGVAIPAVWDAARPFVAGLAPVCRGCRIQRDGEHSAWTGGQWGYVGRDGTLRIPLRYDDAWPADPATPDRLRVRLGACTTEIDPSGAFTGPSCR